MTAWPTARRSPSGDRYVPDWSDPGAPPSTTWTAEAGRQSGGRVDPVFGQPLVVGDWVYDLLKYPPGPNQDDPGGHLLEGRDRASGQRRWQYELDSVPTTHVVLGDEILVGVGETVHAVDRRSGARRWTRTLRTNVRSITSMPGQALLSVSGQGRSEDWVVALAPDGTERWSRGFDRGLFDGFAVGRYVYGVHGGETVYALRPADGTVAWTAPATVGSTFELVASACGVYVVASGDVQAFTDGGTDVWRYGNGHRRCSTDGERVYSGVNYGGDALGVRALDAASGDLVWEVSIGTSYDSAPIVTDDAVYLRAVDELVAVAPDDGEVLWRWPKRLEHVALADGTFYVTEERVGRAVLHALA